MRRLAIALAVTAAIATACSSSSDNATTPTATPTPTPTSTTTEVAVALGTIPAASSTSLPAPPPEGTTRGTVVAMTGGDGPGDHHTSERYPPVPDEIDLGPLPPAITEQQGRTDPAAVARQWAGVKVRTSGLLDGPLWPLSVGAHLRALSDPIGQWLPNSELQAVDVIDSEQLDPETAALTVRVEAVDEAGAAVTLTYDIELWLSDAGYWLVAFADVQT
jgi:hypothetical protein